MAFSAEHIQINRISAEDLKEVAFFSKMASYAVVGLINAPRSASRRTPTDREGHTRPTWNCSLLFPIPTGTGGAAVLRVLIRREGLLGLGDQDVGTAEILLNDLKRPHGVARCAVRRPSGRTQGAVAVSYQFIGDDRPAERGSGTLSRASLEGGLVGGFVGGLLALALSGGGIPLQTGGRRALEQLLRVCEEVSPLAGTFASALRSVLGRTPGV